MGKNGYWITLDDRYKSLEEWLSEHDKQIRAEAIDEFNNALKTFVRRNGTIPNNFNSDIIAEQLKEQDNENTN